MQNMSSSLLQIFETYQKARVQFVQSVAEAATRPQNIDVMQNAGVMQLLRPLLLDNVREEAVSCRLGFGLMDCCVFRCQASSKPPRLHLVV